MSAVGIGASRHETVKATAAPHRRSVAAQPERRVDEGRPEATPVRQQVLTALGALIKWIPAEVVAGYAATVQLMQPSLVAGKASKPPVISWSAWIIALVATPILVALGAWLATSYNHLVAKVLLSIPAFGLWSASVPYSVWNKSGQFRDNTPFTLFLLLIITGIFTAVAEKLAPATKTT